MFQVLLVLFDVKSQVALFQQSLRSVGINVFPSKFEAAGARPAYHAFSARRRFLEFISQEAAVPLAFSRRLSVLILSREKASLVVVAA